MERLAIEKSGELLIKNADCEYRSPCFGCESIRRCNPSKMPCSYYKALEKLKEYEDLEEQGNLLKNPQELKDRIVERMKEFMDEYHSYSESSIDHFGGKADAMETAIRTVKAEFADALDVSE